MNREAVGKRLRELRLDRKESMEAVGSAVGVSRQSVQLYELGERMPSDDIKVKLAAHFGNTVQAIFFDN